MLLLASEEAVERHQLPVLGRLAASRWAALDPSQMGLGPVHAMGELLQRQGLQSEEIDYWEINEAFATQVLACQAAWQDEAYMRQEVGLDQGFAPIPDDRLNVDGGAVSIGHPVGASGARLVLHLLKTLQQRRAKRGVASLCIGGGQGGAMLLEAVS
jgi:acetyl-CoA C-acetyltransferase